MSPSRKPAGPKEREFSGTEALRVIASHIGDIQFSVKRLEILLGSLEPFMDDALGIPGDAEATPYENYSEARASIDYTAIELLGYCEDAMKYAVLSLRKTEGEAE